MRVLVIGGNRFFGKRFVEKLILNKADVTLLNRGLLGDSFGEQVTRIVVDRKFLSRSHPKLKNEKWDLIVDQACYEAADALNACETFSGLVGHYLFTSTASVYEQKAALTEKDFDPLLYKYPQLRDQKLSYAEAKRQCEAIFSKETAFPLTALRLPFVLGSDDYTGRLNFHIDRISKAEPIFFPKIEAQISLISSEDAAEALYFIGNLRKACGPINCASEEPISLRRFVSLIESVVGQKAKLLSKPEAEALSPYGVENDWWMRIDKIKKLGFFPTSIDQWLPQLIQRG